MLDAEQLGWKEKKWEMHVQVGEKKPIETWINYAFADRVTIVLRFKRNLTYD